MDYRLVSASESYPDDVLKKSSFLDRINRRFQLFPQRSPLFSSPPVRQLRYIGLAIVLIFILYVPLPIRPFQSIDASKRNGPFNIQYAFKEETRAVKTIRIERQQKVKDAFLHAWKGYKEHAWMRDEVMPLSGGHKDPFVGWAATMVDGLDILYIMGLQDEFDHALEALKTIDFTKPNAERVPVFETTIRYLGGLLGAYDVSEGKYPILLKKAHELGDFLFRAFNTTNGMPVPYYWWEKPDQKLVGENGVLIAQVGKSKKSTIFGWGSWSDTYRVVITRIYAPGPAYW